MELTPQDAQALASRISGGREVTLFPFEFGWLARESLTAEESASGKTLGQGSFIVDRTGVVTVHPSLPLDLVVARYTTERREGRITGRQIWPPTEPG